LKQKRGSTILNKQDGDFYDDEADRGFSAYVAAIIVVQEVFGVNPGIRRTCEKWAKTGCRAVALDLFWGIKPGIERDPD
jgi:carboxymethylenebutenolidase